MDKTPVKQSSESKVCLVCANVANRPSRIESARSKYNLKKLLLQYGGIHVESGLICRNCVNKLFVLHEKNVEFFNLCQGNYHRTVLKGKRLLPSTPVGQSSRASKRQNVSDTPKHACQSTDRMPSKIPTPIAKHREAPITPKNSPQRTESRVRTPSRIPTPIAGHKNTPGIDKKISKMRLNFGTINSETQVNAKSFSDEGFSFIDETDIEMEIETGEDVRMATPNNADNGTATCEKRLETGTPADKNIATVDQRTDVTLVDSRDTETKTRIRSATTADQPSGNIPSEHIYSKKEKTKKGQVKEKKTCSVQPHADHDYISSSKPPTKFNLVYEDLCTFINSYDQEGTCLNDTDCARLVSAIFYTKNVNIVGDVIYSIPELRKCVTEKQRHQIQKDISSMNKRKVEKTVLMEKQPKDLHSFNWFKVISEFKIKFPDLFYLILSTLLKPEETKRYSKLETVLPRLGLVYSILMQGRHIELSATQRVVSLFLFDNICDQKVFDRLHRLGVCLSYEGSLRVMESVGGTINEKLVDLIKSGKRFRIIGDNINWTVGVHDQRVDNRGKMFHAFGSAVIVQNLDFSHLGNAYPVRHFGNTPVQEFLPSENDINEFKHDYTILIARVALQHVPLFQKFRDVIPTYISKPISESLRLRSKVIPLPVLMKNEQKYQDVVEILDYYQGLIDRAARGAGRRPAELQIHIGGDQLTRERFSGAKVLRANEDDPSARFESLSPITFELFHLHMNFLKMCFDVLYRNDSVNDQGSLRALQNIISRDNVDDNINAHYDADKDFFVSVVDAYIVELLLEYFGLDTIYSEPTNHAPPQVFQSDEDKSKWLTRAFGEMLDKYLFGRLQQTRDTEEDGIVLNLLLPSGRRLETIIPSNQKLHEQTSSNDGVQTYARRLLELGLLYKDMLDATRLPERHRWLRIFKLLMLLFKNHRNKSKYAYEIMRLLVHQICLLSEKAASEEFYGLFVNTNGHVDGHIPADQRMEYLVKEEKEHIKHVFK